MSHSATTKKASRAKGNVFGRTGVVERKYNVKEHRVTDFVCALVVLWRLLKLKIRTFGNGAFFFLATLVQK